MSQTTRSSLQTEESTYRHARHRYCADYNASYGRSIEAHPVIADACGGEACSGATGLLKPLLLSKHASTSAVYTQSLLLGAVTLVVAYGEITFYHSRYFV